MCFGWIVTSSCRKRTEECMWNEFLSTLPVCAVNHSERALIPLERQSEVSESIDSIPLNSITGTMSRQIGVGMKGTSPRADEAPWFKTQSKQNKMCRVCYRKWVEIAGPWLKCHCFSPTIRRHVILFQSLSSWRMNRWLRLLCPTSQQCLIMKLGGGGGGGEIKNVTRRLPA